MSYADVWDIEAALENATKTAFDTAVTVYTTQSKVEFQKERPRLEVVCQLGAGRGQIAPPYMTGFPVEIENTFSIIVAATLVTDADMGIHRNFRSIARQFFSQLPALVNPLMKNHEIYLHMKPGATSPILKHQEGVYRTEMTYSTEVSILASAWALAIA